MAAREPVPAPAVTSIRARPGARNIGRPGDRRHTASISTAPAGTPINGGAFLVPAALANKVIHPYSDFLVHDIGSGDGIPVLPTAEYAATASQIRTAPLWALRTRNRLMHDGLSFTREKAIQRHAVKYVDGQVHTNGLENFWSLLKRGLAGTYVSVEPFHLFRDLEEQAYRYNNRKEMNDFDRFKFAASQIVGKRLTWKQANGMQESASWAN